MIDTVAHLDDPRLQKDLSGALLRAHACGVTDVVYANAVAPISGFYPVRLWRAAGLHPKDVTPAWAQALAMLEHDLCRPHVVAIGEVGLDDRDRMPAAELQEAALVAQLLLARQKQLPFIVHCVGKLGRLLELLSTHGPHAPGFVLHAFAGPAEMIPAFAELGAYFSFGGLITRGRAKKAHKAAAAVPQDRLLVESDAPDMPAQLWEGPSSPAMLVDVLAALADWRAASPQTLADVTAQNARRLYNLDPPSKMDLS